MIQLKIAFLDEEELYLEQLKGYLVRKKEMFFKVWTFSKLESFLAGMDQEEFDAVVMTYPFWEKTKDCQIPAKKILLWEEECKEQQAEGLFVEKYQSAEKLFCKISSFLWQEGQQRSDFPGNAAELIGVYSPVHQEEQMLFSMTMAQILGEQQKVLYINLMEHSGFYGLLGTEAEADIGDLLYDMMQEGCDFAAGLHGICQSCRNFDYIPPAVNPEHLSEISRSLYEKLLTAVKTRSGYDVVIVDFGRIFLGFAEMLQLFGSFYCLEKEGRLNRCRAEEFQEYLEKECACVSARIHHLRLSERLTCPEEVNLLEANLYGGMGDYIRRTLYGGVEIGG